ncbi:MAG: SDR family oxidoreductase [Gammaproteobacteria bacterium]|nr:SDR family oxidoreductase [Gammaproteobacteria bacterium]
MPSPSSFKDRLILITGCSSGIGYCVAHGLHKRGYNVIASARKPEDVERLRNENLQCIQLDLDNSDSINKAVDDTLQLGNGTIYALFNNASFGQPGAVEDLSRNVLRQQFETNFFGTAELTNKILPIMRKQGFGRIIQNSSVLGLITLCYRGAYNASKFALEGLTDTLRQELADTDIHVSLIEPGPVKSRFRANAFEMYKKNIDAEHSAHRETYRKTEQRLKKKGDAAPFTLPPDAVLEKVIHALESRRPKPRYYVTIPTYIFGILKRFSSTRFMDRILLRVSRSEHR